MKSPKTMSRSVKSITPRERILKVNDMKALSHHETQKVSIKNVCPIKAYVGEALSHTH